MQDLIPRILKILNCIILSHTNEQLFAAARLMCAPRKSLQDLLLYFESFRDLNVPQCCQLDARAKHPEVFSLCEPEHLPVPEVQIHSLEKTIMLHRGVSTYISNK